MRLQEKLFLLLIFLLSTQLGRHFWPNWSYVLGLRVDYLSPTIYLTDLLVFGIFVLWGLEKLKTPASPAGGQNSKFFCLPFTVFCFLLVNSLLAQNPGAALYKFGKIIEFSLLGFYIAKKRYALSTIGYPLVLAVIWSSLLAIFQFINQATLGGIFWWLGERTFTVATPGIAKAIVGGRLLMRPYSTFPHPNVLAGFLLVCLIIVGGWKVKTRIWKFLKWTALVLGILAIALSFSRSAWLVGLLVLILVVFKFFPDKKKLLFISYFLISLALASCFYFSPQFSTEEAVGQRLQLIKVSFKIIQNYPLAGVGLNNFIIELPEYWSVQSIYWLQPVHNIFLLVATETGLVGLVIILWFLILTYKKLLITNYYLLITALSAILALGLFDHYWLTLQQSQLLFTIILGLSWQKKDKVLQ